MPQISGITRLVHLRSWIEVTLGLGIHSLLMKHDG